MSKFNIGDKVKVVRVGQTYTTYPQWAENQKMTNYVGYGLKDSDVGVVIAKAKHSSRVDYDMLYGIELDNGKQFIIGEPGLEIVKTISEYKVGDKVEVVEDGKQYSYYDTWALENGLTNYIEGRPQGLKDGDIVKVISIAPHSKGCATVLLGVEKANGEQRIIDQDGVKIYKEKEMTKYKVGDKVKVIKSGYGVAQEDIGKITSVTSLSSSDGFSGRIMISTKGFESGYSFSRKAGETSCATHALQFVEAAAPEKPKTPAEQAGFVIGSKYVMIKEDSFMSKGTVVIFVKDDGSRCPYFQNAAIPGKASHGRNSAAFLNLTDMAPYVDFTKPVFTMEGTQVDVVTTTNPRDAKFPVLAYEGKAKTLSKFTIHGVHKRGPARRNLTNDAPKVEVVVKPAPKQAAVYVNLYANGDTGMNRATRAEADRVAGNNPFKRVACKKIVITEGEFDE